MSYYREIPADELESILANNSLWHRTNGEEGQCANLTRANLTRANLTRANLIRADLAYANLAYANLTGADLTGADLAYANLTDANLTDADLAGANLTRTILPALDFDRLNSQELSRQILEIVKVEPNRLKMDQWHTCETTHCVWGWAVVLNGESGRDLEKRYGTISAGALLFPEFSDHVLDSDEAAIEKLKELAGEGVA